ncbi:hypothetical protein RI129_012136 [Pyrocoelia pectoralis]|uniref:THD domain-containing protein n=1 Tax=Pyrocoelia pectoralis TaxID=417401 RepID=A0AAN7V998_9COLE
MIIDLKKKEMVRSPVPEKNIRTDFTIKVVLLIGATLILLSSLAISVCAVLRLKQIQEEVVNLRWEINQLKLGDIVDSQLIEDLKKFENEEMYPDTDIQPFVLVPDLDDEYLFEGDLNYDNLETLLDNEKVNIESSDLLNNKSTANVLKSTGKSKRDTTRKSIPITELYDTIPRRDKTTQHKEQIHEINMEATDNYSQKTSEMSSSDILQNSEDQSKKLRRMRKRRAKASTRHQWESVGEDTTFEDSVEPRRRNRHRQKNNIEIFDEKPRTTHMRAFPAIQLVGDTSKYIMGQHTNYNGNGHLRHTNPTYVDWIANEWVQSTNMDKHFEVNDGTIKVKENGLYFVYSQIFYLDEHDTNGYRVFKNKEVFLQCTTMTHSTERIVKGNTCYTAGLTLLNEGDEVNVQDLGTGRYSIFEPGKSFFGLIKIADIRVK